MNEDYLQFLFASRSLSNEFITTDNRALTIVDFGIQNHNSGPDFLDARIKLEDVTWAGNIEFHVKASDWFLHKHQNDDNYKNVIAHFVYEADASVYSGSYDLPTVELKSIISKDEYDRYSQFIKRKSWTACDKQISSLPESLIKQTLESALENRLARKSNLILSRLDTFKGDRLRLFYYLLAVYFGGKVNQTAFVQLFSKIGSAHIKRLKARPFEMEALLLGLSGLIPKESNDTYIRDLQIEFKHLQNLFSLDSLEPVQWKYSRMRPPSFPPLRIAQFASLLSHEIDLDQLLNTDDPTQIRRLLMHAPSDYWRTHYRFESICKSKSSRISRAFADRLIINAIVPYIYAIGVAENDNKIKKRSIPLLDKIASEKNTIISKWDKAGIKTNTAARSQALIELKNQHCDKMKCLSCSIGKSLLTTA
ncbi:DUF2851 family protein [Crocinitomix catalasitica]|nr:DUF2851 family protein [Crocinitomix catalasitica]